MPYAAALEDPSGEWMDLLRGIGGGTAFVWPSAAQPPPSIDAGWPAWTPDNPLSSSSWPAGRRPGDSRTPGGRGGVVIIEPDGTVRYVSEVAQADARGDAAAAPAAPAAAVAVLGVVVAVALVALAFVARRRSHGRT